MNRCETFISLRLHMKAFFHWQFHGDKRCMQIQSFVTGTAFGHALFKRKSSFSLKVLKWRSSENMEAAAQYSYSPQLHRDDEHKVQKPAPLFIITDPRPDILSPFFRMLKCSQTPLHFIRDTRCSQIELAYLLKTG